MNSASVKLPATSEPTILINGGPVPASPDGETVPPDTDKHADAWTASPDTPATSVSVAKMPACDEPEIIIRNGVMIQVVDGKEVRTPIRDLDDESKFWEGALSSEHRRVETGIFDTKEFELPKDSEPPKPKLSNNPLGLSVQDLTDVTDPTSPTNQEEEASVVTKVEEGPAMPPLENPLGISMNNLADIAECGGEVPTTSKGPRVLTRERLVELGLPELKPTTVTLPEVVIKDDMPAAYSPRWNFFKWVIGAGAIAILAVALMWALS